MTVAPQEVIRITAPKMRKAQFKIQGTAPFVQLRFSEKAQNQMAAKMEAGSQANKNKAKAARDFEDDFKQSMHVSMDGWYGIPASAIRKAMISACRLVGFKMTLAKLSIFVEAEGFDKVDGLPLIRIYGTPEAHRMHVRNATGVADLRVRAMWREWYAKPIIVYDEDQFSAEDVTNLMLRVGMQVGLGEGRADSKDSAGLGWGSFDIVNDSAS